jgi:hypothetical protein
MKIKQLRLSHACLALLFCLFGSRVFGVDACGTHIADDLVCARFAAWVYRDAPDLPEPGLPDDLIESGWETWSRHREKSGLDWALFINKRERKVILAFRGTEQWLQDLIEADLGGVLVQVPVRQYTEAASKALQVRSLIEQFDPGLRLILTGHSLGGGLAQYAGAVNHMEAVTFNPAWVNRATLQWGCGISRCDVSRIRSYLYRGDWVGMLQSMVVLNSRMRLRLLPSGSDIVRLNALVDTSDLMADPVDRAVLKSDAPILPPLGEIVIVGGDQISHKMDVLIAEMEELDNLDQAVACATHRNVLALDLLSLQPNRDPAVISSDFLSWSPLRMEEQETGSLVYTLQVRNEAAQELGVRVRVGEYRREGERPASGRESVRTRIAAGETTLIALPLQPPRNPGRYRATIILEGQRPSMSGVMLPGGFEKIRSEEVSFEVVSADQPTVVSPSRLALGSAPSDGMLVVAPNEIGVFVSREVASRHDKTTHTQSRGSLESTLENALDTIGKASEGMCKFLEGLFRR